MFGARRSSDEMTLSVLDFGAVGDGKTVNTDALHAAIEACSRNGGGTVVVPPGRYVTGSVFLHDNITLHLDSGAVLLGSEDPTDYPIIHSRWEGADQPTHAPLITGVGLQNVAVVGRGTVDGRGGVWWQKHRDGTLDAPRPRLISLADCSNVLIEGITAINSPAWTITPLRCEYVTVDKVTILNPWGSPNTDGINPDSCRNVHISNCHIDAGDDCITIKSGTEALGLASLSPCENITITNCTMAHGHGGVVIGSEMSGDVRRVAISNCVFVGTERGIRLKSRRGRGGVVEDIRVTNVIMDSVRCPFIMNLFYDYGVTDPELAFDKNARPVNEGTPRFRRIGFSHITARNAQYAAAFLVGLPEMPIADVWFEDVTISMAVDAPSGDPDMAPGFGPFQRAGFFAQHVRGLRLERVDISGQLGEALLFNDVTLTGKQTDGEGHE
jgi:polygalacturonase